MGSIYSKYHSLMAIPKLEIGTKFATIYLNTVYDIEYFEYLLRTYEIRDEDILRYCIPQLEDTLYILNRIEETYIMTCAPELTWRFRVC
jgi:hypothetical protein